MEVTEHATASGGRLLRERVHKWASRALDLGCEHRGPVEVAGGVWAMARPGGGIDLARYTRLAGELREVAEDLEPYGKRSGNDLLHDLNRAQKGDKVAQGRLAAHRRVYAPDGIEIRDLGAGSVFAQLPDWLVESPAPTAIASAPLLS